MLFYLLNSTAYTDRYMLCCVSGIPFGSVNLLHGVDKHESKVMSLPMLPPFMLEYVGLQLFSQSPRVAISCFHTVKDQ